jgi:hypothetical protein
VAYLARKDKAQFVVVDGKPGPEYAMVVPAESFFRRDGSVEYLGITAGKHALEKVRE